MRASICPVWCVRVTAWECVKPSLCSVSEMVFLVSATSVCHEDLPFGVPERGGDRSGNQVLDLKTEPGELWSGNVATAPSYPPALNPSAGIKGSRVEVE